MAVATKTMALPKIPMLIAMRSAPEWAVPVLADVLAALLDVGVECEDVSDAVLVPFIPLQCVRPSTIGAEEIFNLVLMQLMHCMHH